jgi:hypothetical protein
MSAGRLQRLIDSLQAGECGQSTLRFVGKRTDWCVVQEWTCIMIRRTYGRVPTEEA